MAEAPLVSPKPADLRALTLKTTEAAHHYAIKDYTTAADLYSEATELQTQLYGEMAPQNADLLYAYGRCLYHVAVGNNDVLGGGVAGEGEGGKNKRKRKAPKVEGLGAHRVEEGAEAVEQEQLARGVGGNADGSTITPQGQGKKEESKPYFQITGDAEEWDDSDSDDRGGESEAADGEDGEEDGIGDDFATAYEILDLARLLLSQKIEALAEKAAETGHGKSKKKDTTELSQAKERLADIHDLQAEISMENGRFADAITDAKASLVLKEELLSKESNLVAEAHFKLSLALEFASVTRVKSADGAPHVGGEVQVDEGEAQVDEAMREEAAMHMEAAIESSKRRVDSETKSLGSLEEEIRLKTEKSIADVKGMIQEMEERVGSKVYHRTESSINRTDSYKTSVTPRYL